MNLKTLSWLAMTLILVSLLALIADIFTHGLGGLTVEFFTQNPSRGGRAGGIASVVVSTLTIVGMAISIALPLGLSGAFFLSTFCKQQNRFAIFIRAALDILSATPSIIFGLFGSAFFCLYLDLGFSLASGGLTLSCMILPLIVRLTEDAIRSLPSDQVENAYSLGFSKTSTFIKVIFPLIIPSLTAAITLAIARSLSETAALLFTSGYVSRMPESILDSGRTLSVHIFDLSMNVPGGDMNAYSSALVLLVLLTVINTLTSILSNTVTNKYGVL